jgi:hypothetical protein
MKILIIALPRTGSTSLLEKYEKKFNLTSLFEPYDGSGRWIYNSELNDVVMKTMIYHTPYGYSDVIDGYVELSKEFDEVILLTRKNLNECAESWAYLKHFNHKNFNSVKEYVWKNVPDLEKHTNDIIRWNQELIIIGEILNIGLTYYEDIFDIKSNERYRKFITTNEKKLI